MASAKEVTNCPNCSKDYQENGDFVPIILPCFHTFCKNCVRNLSANETSLKCYDCESRHRIPKGTTPPVNKCFIAYIQFNEDDTCTVHGKNSMFFCRDLKCQKGICVTCVVQEHKLHDFVEMIDEKERLVESLTTEVKARAKELEKNREKLCEAKLEVNIRNGLCVTELKASKKEILRKISQVFDSNINHVMHFRNRVNKQIEDKIAALNYRLDVMRHTKTVMRTSLTQRYLSSLLAKVSTVKGTKKVFSQYYAYNGSDAEKKAEKLYKYNIPSKNNADEEKSISAQEQTYNVSQNLETLAQDHVLTEKRKIV